MDFMNLVIIDFFYFDDDDDDGDGELWMCDDVFIFMIL